MPIDGPPSQYRESMIDTNKPASNIAFTDGLRKLTDYVLEKWNALRYYFDLTKYDKGANSAEFKKGCPALKVPGVKIADNSTLIVIPLNVEKQSGNIRKPAQEVINTQCLPCERYPTICRSFAGVYEDVILLPPTLGSDDLPIGASGDLGYTVIPRSAIKLHEARVLDAFPAKSKPGN